MNRKSSCGYATHFLLMTLFLQYFFHTTYRCRWPADDLQIYLSGPMVDAALVVERINTDLATGLWAMSWDSTLKSLIRLWQSIGNFWSLPFFLLSSSTMPLFKILPNWISLAWLWIVVSSGRIRYLMWYKSPFFLLSRLWCTASFTPIETRRRLVVALILPIFLYYDVMFSQFLLGNCRDSILHIILVEDMSTEFPVLSTSLIMPGVS
jgi:hypothetical protein